MTLLLATPANKPTKNSEKNKEEQSHKTTYQVAIKSASPDILTPRGPVDGFPPSSCITCCKTAAAPPRAIGANIEEMTRIAHQKLFPVSSKN